MARMAAVDKADIGAASEGRGEKGQSQVRKEGKTKADARRGAHGQQTQSHGAPCRRSQTASQCKNSGGDSLGVLEWAAVARNGHGCTNTRDLSGE